MVVCLSASNRDVVPDSLCNMTARPTDVEDCNLHRCGTGRPVCRLTDLACFLKPEFHYADFPVTSATNP